MPKKWHSYSEDERLLYVALLRNDGFSDDAIGKFFKSTKGTVVGFRHRRLPDFINLPKASKSSVASKRFDELMANKKAVAAARRVIEANDGIESPYAGSKRVALVQGAAKEPTREEEPTKSESHPIPLADTTNVEAEEDANVLPRSWWPEASEAWGEEPRPTRQGALIEAKQCVWNEHLREARCFAEGDDEPRLCVYHRRAFEKFSKMKPPK
jgi:hypothetical protein